MTTIIEQNRDKLIELCRKYHVAALDVFGSAATDAFDEQGSDVDLLVEFDSSVKARRFDNFFALHDELQRLLQRPVDLVEPGGLRNPYFIDSVEKTRKRLYAANAYKSFVRRPIKSEITRLDGMGSESMTAFGLFFWIWEACFFINNKVWGTSRK